MSLSQKSQDQITMKGSKDGLFSQSALLLSVLFVFVRISYCRDRGSKNPYNIFSASHIVRTIFSTSHIVRINEDSNSADLFSHIRFAFSKSVVQVAGTWSNLVPWDLE